MFIFQTKIYTSKVIQKDFTIKTLENLVEFKRKTIDDEYKEIIKRIFESLQEIHAHLQMDSWNLINQKIFQKLLQKLYKTYLTNPVEVEDFKEIFIQTSKNIFILLIQNQIDPIVLINSHFNFLLNISECQNKMILDCLTLILNDTILITASTEKNPWLVQIWEEIIKYLSSLFKQFSPNELIQNQVWKEMNDKKLPFKLEELQAEIFPNTEFTAFKCRFILNLIKLIQIILKKTDLLSETIDQIFSLMDQFMEISCKFNNYPLNRYILWKKGYFSQKNCLPSLFIFEKNVLLAKFFYYQKNINSHYKKFFQFVHDLLQNYQKKIQLLQEVSREFNDKKKNYFVDQETEFGYKVKNLEEKQTSVIIFYNLINEYLNPFLNQIDYQNFDCQNELQLLRDEIINFLPVSKIRSFQTLNCYECSQCKSCEDQNQKIKEEVSLVPVLQKLIYKYSK